MRKRSTKMRDKRKTRLEHRAAHFQHAIESMSDSEFEAYLSGLTAEQRAAVFLVKYSTGITDRALDAVFSVTMDTAERGGVDPSTVALDLLAIREMSPVEQARALPDPRLRAYLSGFLEIRDESAARLLAALRIMDEEAAKFSRLSRLQQGAILREQEARKRAS